jgi:hypothetical protein
MDVTVHSDAWRGLDPPTCPRQRRRRNWPWLTVNMGNAKNRDKCWKISKVILDRKKSNGRQNSNWHRIKWKLFTNTVQERSGRSGDRTQVEAKFSAPVQTGPGAHPVSFTMGTGTFPEVKQPGRGADHPSTSTAEVKETVQLHVYSPSRPSWSVLGWSLPLPYKSSC